MAACKKDFWLATRPNELTAVSAEEQKVSLRPQGVIIWAVDRSGVDRPVFGTDSSQCVGACA